MHKNNNYFEKITKSRLKCSSTKHRPDDGGSKHLWNVDKLLPDYTVQQPRRRPLHIRRRENLKSQKNFELKKTMPLNYVVTTHTE
jgi:hypothetical protein